MYSAIIHCVSKNVTPLPCHNFDIRERMLIFFGRDATDKVSDQKTFTRPPQITCASALPGKTGNRKLAFFTRCVSALAEFNQLLLDFFNLFDSRLILALLYDSLNLVTNAFSLGLLWAMVQEKGSWERCSSWTALHAQSTSALSCGVVLKQLNITQRKQTTQEQNGKNTPETNPKTKPKPTVDFKNYP